MTQFPAVNSTGDFVNPDVLNKHSNALITPESIGAQPSGSYANSSHTHPSSQITDATATGRSILTAANAGAVRTAIGAQVEGTYISSVTLANIPSGSVIYTDGLTRPTSRTDIMVIFRGPDPGNNALNGDEWWSAS